MNKYKRDANEPKYAVSEGTCSVGIWLDEEAARHVTFVEIPALEGGYRAFYNPGGPGPEPFEGIRYTAPGPPDMEPVIIALDDPMRVDRDAP